MALHLFRSKAKQGTQTDLPTPASPEDQFRSPFTDQREDAPDNWARPVSREAAGNTASQTQPVQRVSWQDTGYHMEATAADYTPALDEHNDPGYVTPEAPDWHDDPFRDSAVDPGLRGQRSKAVENLSGPFFEETAMHPSQATGAAPGQTTGVRPAQRPRFSLRALANPGSRVLPKVALILGVLAIIGLCIYNTALQIVSISVEGNVTISDEEIIRLSGIKPGDNVLTLNDEKICAGIQTNSYLVYNGITRNSFQNIVISVREREPAAYINYCGLIYIIDNRGALLAMSDDTDHPPELLRLEGVEIRNAPMGEKIIPTSAERLNLYTTIMLELKAMQAEKQIVELYVSDMDNLYIGTKDGFSVYLGTSQDLHAKLRSMILTLEELRERRCASGTVDVSTPASPNYIPETSPVS